jgi:WD repeat-containing protein 89
MYKTTQNYIIPRSNKVTKIDEHDGNDEDDEGEYVFDLSVNCDNTAIASTLSSMDIGIHDSSTLQQNNKLENCHMNRINGVEYLQHSPSVLVTASDDKSVKVFDMRSPTPSNAVLNIRTPGEAMDIAIGSNDALLVCAVNNGVTFYDLRQPNGGNGSGAILGSYSDVNTDTVTQVKFNPQRPNELVTGGEDGLIVTYNTNVSAGDEPIVSMFNIDCPVRRFGFFGQGLEGIYCLSTVETASVWHAPSAQRLSSFDDIRESLGLDYLVDCMYNSTTDALTLIGGKWDGSGYLANMQPNNVQIVGTLSEGHTAGIRCALSTAGGDIAQGFVTGGEDSKLCMWNSHTQQHAPAPVFQKSNNNKKSNKLSKKDNRRYTPY